MTHGHSLKVNNLVGLLHNLRMLLHEDHFYRRLRYAMTAVIGIHLFIASLLFCSAYGDPNSGCDKSKCGKTALFKYYSELRCTPTYDGDSCCPIKYDCSNLSLRSNAKCHYQGEEFDLHTRVPAEKTVKNCLASCGCFPLGEKPYFNCAQIECPELFNGPLTDPSCFRQYSHDYCCSVNTLCLNETSEKEEKIFQCEYEGEKYYKGQKFYPKDECKTCICDEGYDGSSNEPWCKEFPCNVELTNPQRISEGCVPVFFNSGCCPVEWRCPSDSDSIIKDTLQKTPSTSNQENADNQLTCNFGNLKLSVNDELSPGESEKIKCTCLTPPFVTCILTYP